MAAKEKGSDPETNPSLRAVIDKAKNFNMPKENIERAIKKSMGELAEKNLEHLFFEAYGPAGIALIIEGITDNRNRALGEIKQILNQFQGKLAGPGSVKWMFEKKAIGEHPGLLEWTAKQNIEISEKERAICQKLFETLNENEAVQKIYHNTNLCQKKA